MNSKNKESIEEDNALPVTEEPSEPNKTETSADTPLLQENSHAEEECADDLKTELRSYKLASVTGMILLLVIYTTQLFLGKGDNYGLCTVIFGMLAVQKVIAAIRIGRRNDKITAVFYSIGFILVSIFYIVWLFRRTV